MTTLFQLFWAFLRVGLFSVGGGYAAMPLIQSQAVDAYAWLTLSEFVDLVAIAEATPGPIAINAATFVGMRMAGIVGALTATLGCILPSLAIVTALAKVYLKLKNGNAIGRALSCLRPAVVALIAAAFLSIFNVALFGKRPAALENINLVAAALFALALFAIVKMKLHPVAAMFACGALYLLASFVVPGLKA